VRHENTVRIRLETGASFLRCTRVDRARERLQKRDDSLLFFDRKMKRVDLGIDVWVRSAASIVEVDDLFEAGDAAVVHVGRGARDFAQRRCFEGAAILWPPCDCGASFVQKLKTLPELKSTEPT